MSLFRRKATPTPAIARAALKDPVFPCATPGVAAVHVDYDPAIWVRTPSPGQDRTAWVEAHVRAFATDLGLGPSEDEVGKARAALDVVADSSPSHTCDFVSLQASPGETGMVAYVNVVDEELGLLEHGDPQAFVTMADLAAQGGRLQKPRYWPIKRDPRSWLTSSVQDLDRETLRTTWLERAYRCIEADGTRPTVHLYGGGFHSEARSGGLVPSLLMRVDVQLAQPDA